MEIDVWEIVTVSVGVTVGIVVVSALAAAAVSFIDERFFHRHPQTDRDLRPTTMSFSQP
jgi:hypothetical protein